VLCVLCVRCVCGVCGVWCVLCVLCVVCAVCAVCVVCAVCCVSGEARKGYSVTLSRQFDLTSLFALQECQSAEHRNGEAATAAVPHRSLTAMHADQRTVSGPDQVMPAVPGPHEWCWERSEGGHCGVPVAV
jgi:hypothetical protein